MIIFRGYILRVFLENHRLSLKVEGMSLATPHEGRARLQRQVVLKISHSQLKFPTSQEKTNVLF